jgi:DNA-binding IclR family transcriptional regulator
VESLGTVEKAVDILFHLHTVAEPQGVTTIGRSLGLPKSSVHRLLAALARRGLVERSGRGLYRPGVALIALGLGALEREPIVEVAREVLEDAAAEIGETYFLVAARARELLVLDKVEATGFLRVSPRVGERVPVHATAVGVLYFAHAPDLVEVDSSFETYTADTVRDLEALQEKVERAREVGWAMNREEWVPGLGVVAAPIFFGDRLFATVALGAAASRLSDLGVDRVSRHVLAVASRISARLSLQSGAFEPENREKFE